MIIFLDSASSKDIYATNAPNSFRNLLQRPIVGTGEVALVFLRVHPTTVATSATPEFLCVECTVVQNCVIRGRVTQLLAVTDTDGRLKKTWYVPLIPTARIDEIGIKITKQDGTLLDCKDSVTTIGLHFKDDAW